MAENSKIVLKNVGKVFKKYITENIPSSVTNVFWQLYNGIGAALNHLEYKIDIIRRERNILTATQKSSLRSLAAQNGYEPTLKIPSKGNALVTIDPVLYTKKGYPLFIPAYAVFTCEQNGLDYYYDSDKPFRLTSNEYTIPLVEGTIKTLTFAGNGDYINRFYINDENIADKSIRVWIQTVENDEEQVNEFVEVKSFYDNNGLNDNRQFMMKFGNNPQNPIVLYVKGLNNGEVLNVTYRNTFGELGNLYQKTKFTTEDIINVYGEPVDVSDKEFLVENIFGFNLGSNGSDENSLRAAIGYNHGNSLLYDEISYKNFIAKFSTILLQDVIVDPDHRSINNIYVTKKQSLNFEDLDNQQIMIDYKNIVRNNKYVLTPTELAEFDDTISSYEYCLSSHITHTSKVKKYAIQIQFNNQENKWNYQQSLSILIYSEFAKFLYDRYYKLNIDVLFRNFMNENNITFDYYVFNNLSNNEEKIIQHTDRLPILCGDFEILSQLDNQYYQLYDDINYVLPYDE